MIANAASAKSAVASRIGIPARDRLLRLSCRGGTAKRAHLRACPARPKQDVATVEGRFLRNPYWRRAARLL
jgi:hypothetical protein